MQRFRSSLRRRVERSFASTINCHTHVDNGGMRVFLNRESSLSRAPMYTSGALVR